MHTHLILILSEHLSALFITCNMHQILLIMVFPHNIADIYSYCIVRMRVE